MAANSVSVEPAEHSASVNGEPLAVGVKKGLAPSPPRPAAGGVGSGTGGEGAGAPAGGCEGWRCEQGGAEPSGCEEGGCEEAVVGEVCL
mmetsp:Transcript_3757/g.12423  ORF Transcript_3757/g.12423 Transcript_3757/m.12423 type:complete len:89 (+) Transcript_3757:1025-1291(+)